MKSRAQEKATSLNKNSRVVNVFPNEEQPLMKSFFHLGFLT